MRRREALDSGCLRRINDLCAGVVNVSRLMYGERPKCKDGRQNKRGQGVAASHLVSKCGNNAEGAALSLPCMPSKGVGKPEVRTKTESDLMGRTVIQI